MLKFLCCWKKNNYVSDINLNTDKIKNFDLYGIEGNFYVESVQNIDTIIIIVPICLNIYNFISINEIDGTNSTNPSNTIYFNRIVIKLLTIDVSQILSSNNFVNRNASILKIKQAKIYLSELILNKIIKVRFVSYDENGCPLCNIYYGGQLINDVLYNNFYSFSRDF